MRLLGPDRVLLIAGVPGGAVGGMLYFIAGGPSLHASLWERRDGRRHFRAVRQRFGYGLSARSCGLQNGRVYGTYMVQDIASPFGDSNPGSLTVSGNLLYFVADDGVSGPELWAVDVIFDSAFEFAAPPG